MRSRPPSPKRSRTKPVAKKPPAKETVRLLMVVRPNGFLAPATAYDEERMMRFRVGSTVEIVEPDQPRSEEQHKAQRFYRAILSRISKATGIDHEALHWRIRIATGRVHSVALWKNDVRAIPISIADMDAPTFDAFFRDAIDHIQTKILPGVNLKDVFDMAHEDLRTWVKWD